MSENENNLFEIGKVLDNKWVIIGFVGKGAMGEVYRAHQLNLERDVAIKVVSSEAIQEVADDPDESGESRKRFYREVQAMAKVRHSNVLNIYDYGHIDANTEASDGTSIDYIVMEYIPGNTLRFTMSDYGVGDDPDLYSNWIQTYFLPILDGVESIHSHNIIHRDLKPENVFIDADIPKIADFGLARSSRMEAITSSVSMLGTLAYMSPEQCSDFRKSDYKADIYALGKILYEAADGKLTQKTVPFKSVTLKDPETPFMKEIALVIEKATAEDQKDRFENVTELRGSLKKALALHANGHPRNIQNGTTSAPRSNFHDKLIRVGIVFAILFSTATIGWHFMKDPGNNIENNGSLAGHVQQGPLLSPGNTGVGQSLGTATGSIVSEHIGKQQLILGGELKLPTTLESVAGKKVDILAFYMDEFLVTNQQFIDFLNHNLSRITLENGIVRGDGANWYLLGEIYEGYEPIVFRDMEFHISDPGYASSPVLRVTGYGAAAFASSVNRRLPTELEWLYVTLGEADTQTPIENEKIPDKINTTDMENMMNSGDNWGWQKEGWYSAQERSTENETVPTISTPSYEPLSSAFFKQNNFKIRALNKGIGEWGIRTASRPTENSLQDNVFLVMGGIDTQVKTDKTSPHMISRFPWEGFEEVGFRTVATSDN